MTGSGVPSGKNGLPDTGSRRGLALRAAIFVATIVLVGNLDALVDLYDHPEQPYLDTDHLIVGSLAIITTSLLMGGLWVYFDRLKSASADSRHAQAASRESQKKYLELFESSLDMVFICSPLEKVEDINPAGLRMLGYESREEFLKLDVPRDLHFSLEDWAAYERLMLQNGCVDSFEHELRRRDGKKVRVIESSTAIFDQDGNVTGCRGIIHDVTEHRRLENDLLAAQKLESVGRLAGSVAHDFTNHITAIQGNIDLVLMDMPDDLDRKNLLAARHAADAAADLTSQLMLLSRHQPLNIRRVDVNRLVEGMRDMLRLMAGEHISLSTALSADPAAIEAEPGAIRRIVTNLVTGAREAMPDGGAVSVRTANVAIGEDAAARQEDAYPGDFLALSVRSSAGVRDNADGATLAPDCFGFGSSPAASGLPVVYAAALQHRGWVEFESFQDDGCVASIYLPLAPDAAEAGSQATGGEGPLRGNRERLLLVEDDEPVRLTAEKILREHGYKVYAAADARQAFNIFVSQKGEFDLLFSDVVLPGETGFDLAEQLASFKPQLPVLLASGYSDAALDWEVVKSRGYGFLQKPYALANLLKAVHGLLVDLG